MSAGSERGRLKGQRVTVRAAPSDAALRSASARDVARDGTDRGSATDGRHATHTDSMATGTTLPKCDAGREAPSSPGLRGPSDAPEAVVRPPRAPGRRPDGGLRGNAISRRESPAPKSVGGSGPTIRAHIDGRVPTGGPSPPPYGDLRPLSAALRPSGGPAGGPQAGTETRNRCPSDPGHTPSSRSDQNSKSPEGVGVFPSEPSDGIVSDCLIRTRLRAPGGQPPAPPPYGGPARPRKMSETADRGCAAA